LEAAGLSRIHYNPQLDPLEPATWPALLRERDICKDPAHGYPGLLPITQSAFRAAVARGLIEPPLKFGSRVNCWRKETILRLRRDGIPTIRTETEEAERAQP
jgi:hypothetical protein